MKLCGKSSNTTIDSYSLSSQHHGIYQKYIKAALILHRQNDLLPRDKARKTASHTKQNKTKQKCLVA